MKLKTHQGRAIWLQTQLHKLWASQVAGRATRWQVLPLVDFRLEQIASEVDVPQAAQGIREFVSWPTTSYRDIAPQKWKMLFSQLGAGRRPHTDNFRVLILSKLCLYEGCRFPEVLDQYESGFSELFKNPTDSQLGPSEINLVQLHSLDKPAGFWDLLNKMEECLPVIKGEELSSIKAMAWYHETRRFREEDRVLLLQSPDKDVRLLVLDVLARKSRATGTIRA